MKYAQYGSANGIKVIYFHGAPGAPKECAIFEDASNASGLSIICFERFSIDSALTGEAYFQSLAKEIEQLAEGHKIDVIGFSIGAFVALQACRHIPDQIGNLHLISAAAPLDAGDFIDHMAGKPVFQLAQSSPRLFSILTYAQGLLASLAPGLLFRMLFAGAAGRDRELAADPEFQSRIRGVLRSCFGKHARGYARDIRAYVLPWKTSLSGISCNTHLWHGTEDHWAPPAMADYLRSEIPGRVGVEIMEGLSHYSCLHAAVPRICELLGEM